MATILLLCFFWFCDIPTTKVIFWTSAKWNSRSCLLSNFLEQLRFNPKGLADASILGVLWSVAIEEQFYFVWPIILYIFPIKKYWIPFLSIIFISLVFRAFNDNNTLRALHTLSCIGDMAVGALGAWLISEFKSFKVKIENLNKFYIILIYTTFFLIYLFIYEVLFANYGIRIFERIIIAIVILFIILEQNYSKNSFFKLSNYKTISKLGVITYGLYCLHFIGILTVITLTNKFSFNTQLWQTIILDTSLALLLTIIISKISYKYFETPFLRLKNKFTYITK